MPRSSAGGQRSLSLKAGEWVEVRSREEILATLDERGCLENLPFMPEMLQYCGKPLRVYKRADKTCQYIMGWSIRRVENSVHLEVTRCSGTEHGGCEAGCLIFWKEAWLKRLKHDEVTVGSPSRAGELSKVGNGLCTMASLRAAGQKTNEEGENIYSCQATQVYEFSSYMKMWDPRQYIRDLRSGNLSTGLGGKSRLHRTLDLLLGIARVFNAAMIDLFNEVQRRRHRMAYPFLAGTLEKTPAATLDLEQGELVQVKSKEEIVATLDSQNRNRGLLFDSEMLRYCGGIYRVLRRVHQIIDEKTGKMLNMKYPCIILEGVYCKADYHRLCPRAIYSYWREAWLNRVSPNFTPMIHQEEEVASCPILSSAGNK
jgi:hypothetical protein